METKMVANRFAGQFAKATGHAENSSTSASDFHAEIEGRWIKSALRIMALTILFIAALASNAQTALPIQFNLPGSAAQPIPMYCSSFVQQSGHFQCSLPAQINWPSGTEFGYVRWNFYPTNGPFAAYNSIDFYSNFGDLGEFVPVTAQSSASYSPSAKPFAITVHFKGAFTHDTHGIKAGTPYTGSFAVHLLGAYEVSPGSSGWTVYAEKPASIAITY